MNKNYRLGHTINEMSTSLLGEGKSIRIRAYGYSMYPNIRPGVILIVDPLMGRDPVAGEIVAIKRGKGIVVHRIVKVTINNGIRYYTARGDSNPFHDDPVKKDMIAGRIARAETTADCLVMPDLSRKKVKSYFLNRLKVIAILGFRSSGKLAPLRRLFGNK